MNALTSDARSAIVPAPRMVKTLRQVSTVLLRVAWTPARARRHARRLGVNVGTSAHMLPTVQWGSEPWLITVGDRTWVASEVAFLTHDGGICVLPEHLGAVNKFGRITIGADCFIGHRAILLPGITIGDRCIV